MLVYVSSQSQKTTYVETTTLPDHSEGAGSLSILTEEDFRKYSSSTSMEYTWAHLAIVFCLLAPFVYSRFTKSRQQKVCFLAWPSHLVDWDTSKLTESKLDEAIGKQYGCLPPPRLQNQRPLGVDRLEQIFRANTESRLMELFLFHFRQTGNTLEQVFLGTQAFGTVDPANLEAILSTNFKGMDRPRLFSILSIRRHERILNH